MTDTIRRFVDQARGRVHCQAGCGKTHYRSSLGWKFCLRKLVDGIFKARREREMFVFADQEFIRITCMRIPGEKFALDGFFQSLSLSKEALEDALERAIYSWATERILRR